MTSHQGPRVVSLIPSATEIVALLGGGHLLVGRDHESNVPPDLLSAQALAAIPVVTSATLAPGEDAAGIDRAVRAARAEGRDLYALDERRLRSLWPLDVVLTQELCGVCSIERGSVARLLEDFPANPATGVPPRILSLDPYTLADVLDTVDQVGAALNLENEATRARHGLQARIAAVQARPAVGTRVAFLEWTRPLFVGAHWTPELIRIAGGESVLNDTGGGASFTIEPDELTAEDPDVIVIAPCGFDLAATRRAVRRDLDPQPWWRSLRAVREGRVLLVDGDQHFNRPGPRLVHALEWLAATAVRGEDAPDPDFPFEAYGPTRINRQTAPDPVAEAVSPDDRERRIEAAHDAAVARGESGYTDPETGLFVFTALASEQRGHCCGRACRHCVWGHVNVRASRRPEHERSDRELAPAPPVTGRRLFRLARAGAAKTDRSPGAPPGTGPRVVFFSGGKDSLLTLRRVQCQASGAEPSAPVVLLTTFTEEDQRIPEQDISLRHVLRQARKLRLDLMVVPLPPGCSNETYAQEVLAAVAEIEGALGYPAQSARLVFGDLHLEDIRAWREGVFGGARSCEFPLFGVPYDTLAEELFTLDADVYISALGDHHAEALADLGLGLEDRFDRSLYRRLRSSEAIDAFGENGEFHTRVDLR